MTDQQSLKDRLEAIGITHAVFAAVYGLWDADVSRYIRGLRTTPHIVAKMLAGVTELEELRNTSSAPQPNWRSLHSIKDCLDNLREIKQKVQHPVVAMTPKDWFGKPTASKIAAVMGRPTVEPELSEK